MILTIINIKNIYYCKNVDPIGTMAKQLAGCYNVSQYYEILF